MARTLGIIVCMFAALCMIPLHCDCSEISEQDPETIEAAFESACQGKNDSECPAPLHNTVAATERPSVTDAPAIAPGRHGSVDITLRNCVFRE